MALRFVLPFGMVAFGCLPFVAIAPDLQSAPAQVAGAAAVRADAAGALAAGPAIAAGVAALRVDLRGDMQAGRAMLSGTAHARLTISGALQAAPAIMGGVAKPPVFQIAATAAHGQIHLVELEALQRSLTREVMSWVNPFGKTPFGVVPQAAVESGLVSFVFSDKGYTSPPTGSQANTIFLGRVSQPLRMARAIAIAPESDRRINLEFGQISITNTDGSLDSAALQYSVDGRPVTVKLGLDDYEYGDFRPVFTGRATDWTPSFASLDVEVRDQTYLLDVELHPETFGGTGGYDGTADLAGKPRPDCFGKCLNVQPIFVDPANLVYQFHRRAAQAVDAVYDRRVPLAFAADYADYGALVAAAVDPAHFATCLASGLIRLGSSASFVTADVRGDAQGGYVDTAALIAQRLITGYGAYGDSDLDARLWTAFAAAAPGVIGWYSAESVQISAALSQIIGGCSGHWGADFDGLIGAFVLDEPDPANVVFEFDAANTRDIDRVAPPDGTFPPRWRQRVGHGRCWTVMSGEDIAGSVSDADRAFVTEDQRLVTTKSDQTRTEFLTAMDPDPVVGFFDSADDAQPVAERNLRLFGKPRETLKIVTGCAAYMTPVNSTVKVTNPRVANGNGKLFRIIDADVDAGSLEVTVTVWG